MKRWMCIVGLWMVAGAFVVADVRVMGDRVSLRAAPSLEAEVLEPELEAALELWLALESALELALEVKLELSDV